MGNGDDGDDRDEDRRAILARRSRFIALALSGLTSAAGAGCYQAHGRGDEAEVDAGAPVPCLGAVPEDSGVPLPCVVLDGGPAPCLGAPIEDAGPTPCLEPPIEDAGPAPCLDAPVEDAGMPVPCLSRPAD